MTMTMTSGSFEEFGIGPRGASFCRHAAFTILWLAALYLRLTRKADLNA